MNVRAAALSLLAASCLAGVVAGCGSHQAKGAGGAGSPASDQPTASDSGSPSASAGLTDSAGLSDSATDSATISPSDTGLPSFVTTRPRTSKPVPSKPPANLQPCSAPALTAAVQAAHGGLSHAGYVIVYSYHGQIPCQLTGYPGLAVLNASGKQVMQAARTPSGYLGGIRNGKPPFPTVLLNAGQSASALLEGLLTDSAGKGCPVEHALLTTPPGTTVAIKLAATTAICNQVQIHPIVPGNTGNKP
ncbi:MAG: DUF4232 domain-containing protein [Jatrophihabitantaceae bacterium]